MPTYVVIFVRFNVNSISCGHYLIIQNWKYKDRIHQWEFLRHHNSSAILLASFSDRCWTVSETSRSLVISFSKGMWIEMWEACFFVSYTFYYSHIILLILMRRLSILYSSRVRYIRFVRTKSYVFSRSKIIYLSSLFTVLFSVICYKQVILDLNWNHWSANDVLWVFLQFIVGDLGWQIVCWGFSFLLRDISYFLSYILMSRRIFSTTLISYFVLFQTTIN